MSRSEEVHDPLGIGEGRNDQRDEQRKVEDRHDSNEIELAQGPIGFAHAGDSDSRAFPA